jgi:DNA-binding transcriptional LysR family regulator
MAVLPKREPLTKKGKIDLKELEQRFFVGMSEKTYPGARDWLVGTCREVGFTPRILQEAEREPAVIQFVATGLGVALLPQQIKRLPHEGVVFRPLRPDVKAKSCAVWNAENPSICLKQYIQIVKKLTPSMNELQGQRES